MYVSFEKWCEDNNLVPLDLGDNVYQFGDKKYLLIQEKDGLMFDEKFHFLLDFDEEIQVKEVDRVMFPWGRKYYYCPVKKLREVEIIPLKYLGECSLTTPNLPFLGVHGEYEIENGSRDYSDWCLKGKFLKTPTMGICEKNTLGGSISFQIACQDEGIKSILGETVTVLIDDDTLVDLKLYATCKKGWENLLLVNCEINVNNPSQYITEERLLELTEGLVCVFPPASYPYDQDKVEMYMDYFKDGCYFQLDSVEYTNDESDKDFLLNTLAYMKDGKIQPILITDAYYLDADDHIIKPILNSLLKVREKASVNQFFKDDLTIMEELDPLIKGEKAEDMLVMAIANLEEVAERCNYQIPTGVFHLPRYQMNPDEAELYETPEDLFYALIQEGLEKKVIEKGKEVDQYLDRLDTEMKVIQKGGFIDYFLILWDVANFCKKNDILVGLGRGSAAGCLVSYLIGLVQVDPLEYGLLFERFLNEGRLGKSLPDVDCDFEAERKAEIKTYIEEKYGKDRFCSVGTYSSLQLRQAFIDFSKLNNLSPGTVEYLSGVLTESDENSDGRGFKKPWAFFFKAASKMPELKEYVEEYPGVIEAMELCHTQPRSKSVHACATLLLPEGYSIFTTLPIRKGEVKGQKMLVSEWEGVYLEKAGFLKEDLLGISQLDKFKNIIRLVRENYGEDIDIYNIPLDCPEVFKLFSEGKNGDVFQLGSSGLTSYSVTMKPDHINDIVAMIAVYRPGPIENNFHNDYVLLKHGEKEPKFYPGTEEITKDTYSLIIYQEQVMQICQRMGNFTLVEADDIRKAMGKLNLKLIESYEEKWYKGARENGYDEKTIKELWETMVKFSGYSFNKSHSVCYAITGYTCQYLKWKYPLPYWITALQFATKERIDGFISEIGSSGNIKILPPDINKSRLDFFADFNTQSIIWSITKVKQCGEASVKAIFEERDANGEFFSLEEFMERVEKRKANKSVMENLILSGAFDSLEGIKFPAQRRNIIKKYRELAKVKIEKNKVDWFEEIQKSSHLYDDWWWLLQQKRVSSLAFFDYREIIRTLSDRCWDDSKYMDVKDIKLQDVSNEPSYGYGNRSRYNVITGGVIVSAEVRKAKKKGNWMRVQIEQNYEYVWLYIWSEQYQKVEDLKIEEKVGQILITTGRVTWDEYRKQNILQADDNFMVQILG